MVKTAGELIDFLGGTGAVASLAGVGKSAVSNWRAAGRIPPENFFRLSGELGKAGQTADPAIFGFKEEARA